MWDRVLRYAGFGCGVEFEVHDCESEELYCFSTIMATATPSPPKLSSRVVIVTPTDAAPSEQWVRAAKYAICEATGAEPRLQSFDKINVDSGSTYVVTCELAGRLLRDPDPEQFERIRALCTQSRGVLWVTSGGAMDCSDADVSLCAGLMRSLRMEYSGKRLVTLDLDPTKTLWNTESANTIGIVYGRVFNESVDRIDQDFEFAERDGTIFIQRYHKDEIMTKAMFPEDGDGPGPQLESFHQPERPLRLCIGTTGLLDTLAWNDDPDAGAELDPETVEVAAKAFGVNFRDVMVAMGQLNSSLMGFECSGIITRVGRTAEAQGFKPGDRVAMLLRGYYGNLARVHWTSVAHIPDDMSFEIAASLPVSYCTAWVAVYKYAQLQKGESVLIHAATGAFGQAAIVLAQHIGADIYVTAGTEAKRTFITENYGIPPDRIFSSRDPSFAEGIRRATNGRGVDVVLNSLAGILLQESFNCMAPFGRFIEIGKRDLEINSQLAMGAFTRAVTFTSVDLLAFGEQKKLEMQQIFKEVMRLARDGVVVPVKPITTFDVADIEKTYRLMQAGKHMGKIVLSMETEQLVPVMPRSPSAKLRPDSTYLIVGGLGGIGRSICLWMATHGARNILILSRRKDTSDSTALFLSELEKLGCTAEVCSCDIADESSLAECLKERPSRPPIRGVIHAAMVLQVCTRQRIPF
jgi:NADPH:quinone reductase-like Zn-dependent oxidoreductase